jgi:hypothetical protein
MDRSFECYDNGIERGPFLRARAGTTACMAALALLERDVFYPRRVGGALVLLEP